MLYGDYLFSCIFETPAKLPPYKGSTFRGVFGRALKKTVCALRQQQCDTCLLNTRCLYTLAFETPLACQNRETSRLQPPHPFVIEPPLTTKTVFTPGAPFDFRLLLFGDTVNSLPYFIYALEHMGAIGIGSKIDGRRGRFKLLSVKNGGEPIYSTETGKLLASPAVEHLDLPQMAANSRTGSITLTMETPLRLKQQNRLTADLPFHVLVRAMLRRTSSLMHHYGDGEPAIDYKGLVNRAQDIQIIDNQLQWFDWRRYSFRQDKEMLMGGITGSVTYEGDLGDYLPLIEFCERTHLGKQTAFGLGKIKFKTGKK